MLISFSILHKTLLSLLIVSGLGSLLFSSIDYNSKFTKSFFIFFVSMICINSLYLIWSI